MAVSAPFVNGTILCVTFHFTLLYTGAHKYGPDSTRAHVEAQRQSLGSLAFEVSVLSSPFLIWKLRLENPI